MRRLLAAVFLLNLVSQGLTAVDLSHRSLENEDPLLIRKERASSFNSLLGFFDLLGSGFYITTSNTTNTSTFTITPYFWTTFFTIAQYATFVCWFAMLIGMYVFGVAVLFLFSIIAPADTHYGGGSYGSGSGSGSYGSGGSSASYGSGDSSSGSYGTQASGGYGPASSVGSGYVTSWGLFRSFEDENMPLFDKVTSVGYGLLDRSSELYNLVQSPACSRFMMCHLSSTLGDQEANGFLFKDLLRSLSSTLDNKAGTEGMSRSVNVGLLTGECDEPLMNCPELAPYFKKVSDTVSNYI
jgi:hypothetical protein